MYFGPTMIEHRNTPGTGSRVQTSSMNTIENEKSQERIQSSTESTSKFLSQLQPGHTGRRVVKMHREDSYELPNNGM